MAGGHEDADAPVRRRVALKVLAFGLVDERERRSFERECRAMGLVSQHPHIVTVFNAAFSDTKQPCIVMELYSGGTLGERVKQDGPLPVSQVLEVGVKMCGALQALQIGMADSRSPRGIGTRRSG